MLPAETRIPPAAGAFWKDVASTFDLFGLLSENEQPLTTPVSAAKSDQQALADDWKAVFGDLVAAWGMLKIEWDSERAGAH